MKSYSNHRINDRGYRLEGTTSKMLIVVFGLAFVFVFVQFIKLATIGTLGEKISKIKYQQQNFELQNELIRTEISELKSPSNIEPIIRNNTNLEAKNIKIIISPTIDNNDKIIAQR